MPKRLSGILGENGLQLCLGSLVFDESLPGGAIERGEFGSRVRARHIHDPDRLNAWSRGFDPEQSRGVAVFDTAPELPLSGQKEVLVERVGGNTDLDPFAASGNDRKHRHFCVCDPHVVLQLGYMLLGRGFLGERPGQHVLGLEDRSSGFDDAVEGRAHPPDHGMADSLLDIFEGLPRMALEPVPIEGLGHHPELDDQVPGQVRWLKLVAFFPPELDERRFIVSHNDPRVRANKIRTPEILACFDCHFVLRGYYIKYTYMKILHITGGAVNRFSMDLR